jgi:hypothetical protein
MEIASGAAVGLAVVVAVCVPAAQGAEWSMAPTLTVAVDHDSNRTLASTAIPSEGLSMSLDMRLQRATERLNLSLRPQLRVQRFSDRRFDRSDDGGLEAAAKWTTERSSFAVNGLFRDQSSLSAEVAATGIIDLNTRRRDENATVSWTLEQSEVRSLALTTAYLSATYHGNATTLLQDNHYLTFDASERFKTSERLSFSLDGMVGEAHTGGVGDKTHTMSSTVGLVWQITEREQLTADLGVNQRTERSSRTRGFIGDFTFSRSTTLGSYTFSAQRTVAPSGFGLFTQSDEIQLSTVRAMGPRLSWDSSVGWYRTQSAFHSFSIADRTYTQIAMGLSWRATEEWTIGTRAFGSRADSKGILGVPRGITDGWQLRLESWWTPVRRSISR